MLLSTFAISQLLLLSRQEESIYQEEVERAELMANGLLYSLQTLMLSGNAALAHDWIARLSSSMGLVKVQVIRKDKSEAFRDTSTIDKVNAYLQGNAFSRAPLPPMMASDINHDQFEQAVQGSPGNELNRERSELTFLLPIRTQEACMGCHGYDTSPVRGILRITTTMANAQNRIERNRIDTVMYGLAVSIVIGLLLFAFIRRQVIKPLEEITEATSSITAGDLESRVSIEHQSEIGLLGRAFNHMVETLRQTTVSREYFETIMSSMGEMLFVTDMENRIQFANPAAVNALGYSLQELQDRNMDSIVLDDYRLSDSERELFESTGAVKSVEHTFISRDGREIPVLITMSIMHSDAGSHFNIVHAGRDITRQKQTEKELRLAARVMESDSNAILICDCDGNIQLVNPAFTTITGYGADEVIGENPRILQSGKQEKSFYEEMWKTLLGEGMWSGEIWNRRKNGEIYPQWLSITAVYDGNGNITNYVSIFTDITQQKHVEHELAHMAHHDPLTELPNRALFIDRLEQAMARTRRTNSKTGVLFIDIDGFKPINDTHGHNIGDALLCGIADALCDRVRDADTVARVGGDEFVIILEKISGISDVEIIAEKILDRFTQPFDADKIACNVGCSIGIAIAPDDDEDVDSLIQKADMAMYLAKSSGKQRYCVYSRDCVKTKPKRSK